MTRPTLLKLEARGNLIAGEFRHPTDPHGEWLSRSPGDSKDELGKVKLSYAHVDLAVAAARDAFPAWRRLSFAERANLLRKYQEALKRREQEFVQVIAREVGKPLWEARTEWTAMLNKVDITLQDSMKRVEDFEIEKILEGTNGACRYRPLGVMAVLGPYNFPGHLPNGHLVPALATGNTVVFKPSEKAPFVGQLMAECFHEAGFPAGVFNLVQGEKEVGRRLCVHEGVDGVLFTGSYEVGTRIKQDTLQQHWKLLALEMGGKNTSIVWSDADFEPALQEVFVSSFITAGQRCTATSRVLVHASVAEAFIQRFHERAKAFTIGNPLDNPFMGPMIDSSSVDRYMKFLGIAQREGCDLVMRGKNLTVDGSAGHYVTPSVCLVQDVSLQAAKKSVFQQTELFAPCVAILPVRELEEAVELANCTQYGLAASVFTRSRETYDLFWEGLRMGVVNWNKSTTGASSKLPFGGLKKSGNHFPTALSSTTYCTYPVASLEVKEPHVASATAYPGLSWA